jgi:hypothetical protein
MRTVFVILNERHPKCSIGTGMTRRGRGVGARQVRTSIPLKGSMMMPSGGCNDILVASEVIVE